MSRAARDPRGVADCGDIRDATGHTPLDQRLADLAAAQHGAVALRQLCALGLTPRAVRSRVAAGRLHRLYRGVYAVGHTKLTPEGHWLAGVLACGPEALLFQRSAAALLGLRPSARSNVDVATATRAGRERRGIDAHRARIHPTERTIVRGIPTTTVARTLLDCAAVLDRRTLKRAVEQAEILRVFDLEDLGRVLSRANGRAGVILLRDLVGSHQHAPTRSELERRFLELCEDAGIEPPRVNAHVENHEVDFSWPKQRLVVETDGYATHATRAAFERDRARDRRLLLAGWRVARFTWRQVTSEPDATARALRALHEARLG